MPLTADELPKMLYENWLAYQKTGSLISAENLSYIQSNPYFSKIELSENDQELIRKSEAEIKRRKRNRNLLITGLAVLTVCAIGFGIFALNQKNEADESLFIATII